MISESELRHHMLWWIYINMNTAYKYKHKVIYVFTYMHTYQLISSGVKAVYFWFKWWGHQHGEKCLSSSKASLFSQFFEDPTLDWLLKNKLSISKIPIFVALVDLPKRKFTCYVIEYIIYRFNGLRCVRITLKAAKKRLIPLVVQHVFGDR